MKSRQAAVLVGLLLFTFVVTTEAQLRPPARPPAQVVQLCDMVDCLAPPPPPPKPVIVAVRGKFTPEAEVVIFGSDFGPPKGTVGLSAGPYRQDLTVLDWQDSEIVARLPWIAGWPDQTMMLCVTSYWKQESDAWPVSFVAVRELGVLEGKRVTVLNCDRYASENICFRPGPADPQFIGGSSVFGYHNEFWLGHGGRDSYSVTVRNGWLITDVWLYKQAQGIFGGTWAKTTGPFAPGTDSTKVNVQWGTGPWGWLHYWVDIYIVGPAGIPLQ